MSALGMRVHFAVVGQFAEKSRDINDGEKFWRSGGKADIAFCGAHVRF
jgi:hypothetical protein